MTDLAVVVPATNHPPTLDRCLAAIRASSVPAREVLVVDTPGLNVSEARNEGARRATSAVVVFVDADVVVHPDALARLGARFDADPGLHAVFGSYDDAPEADGIISRFRNLLHHHVHHNSAGRADTFWTGLGAVRRDAFLAAGGFDGERYPKPSIEDIDLGYRLCAAGARVELDPTVQGTHLKRWSLASMVWTDLSKRAVPWIVLQLRRRRLSSSLNLGWRHRITALACLLGVLALATGRPAATLGAGAAQVLLNRSFYGLLVRRLGLLGGTLGVGLHTLHHVVALVAVPIGLGVAGWTAVRLLLAAEPEPAVRPLGVE